MTRRLNPRARDLLIGAAVALAILILTQLVFPGRGAGRGTPIAILFQGVTLGLVSALTATGLVVIYRTIRIINFAQSAIGAAGATLTFELIRFTGTPFIVAFISGIALSALVGLVFDLAFGRRFARAPRLVLTVLTIVSAGFIGSTAPPLIQRLPIFPSGVSRATDVLTTSDLPRELPLAGFSFELGSLPLPFGFRDLFAIEVCVIALLALGAFFRYTRAGVAVRAVAENNERAALLGLSAGALGSLVWATAGGLAGASVTLTGLLTDPNVSSGFAPAVLLPALAAAILGRMSSIPLTVASALGISVVSTAARWSFQNDPAIVDVALFLIVAVGLLAQRRKLMRADTGVQASWQATEETRPIPSVLADVDAVRLGRRVLAGAGIAAVVLFPFVASTAQINLGSVVALNAIVVLSLVVLTGWAGQVSLGQFGLVGISAVLSGALTATVGIPFWFAVPIATALTAAFATLVGSPALRFKGLFLAVTTFAFSIVVSVTLFEPRYFGWLLPDSIDRPTLFFIDFTDERSMYFLCLAALFGAIVAVVNLRRSRFGRVLIALRDNEQNVQAFGIHATRTKLGAFAISGALAGFAGAIFAHQQGGLNGASYSAGASIDVFIMAVIGGVGSVPGALLGAAYVNVLRHFIGNALILGLLTGGGTLAILFAAPAGLISLVMKVRDSILRLIAQREQIPVPSLFADFDPEALERRHIPLAATQPGGGLSALPHDLRFVSYSELYQGKGARVAAADSQNGSEALAVLEASARTDDSFQEDAST